MSSPIHGCRHHIHPCLRFIRTTYLELYICDGTSLVKVLIGKACHGGFVKIIKEKEGNGCNVWKDGAHSSTLGAPDSKPLSIHSFLYFANREHFLKETYFSRFGQKAKFLRL